MQTIPERNQMNNTNYINVYGAGLAGCEAAWQASQRGVHVKLYEMKPGKYTPAHHSEKFAELVCSNSLRSDQITNAAGLLKAELRKMNSLIISAADAARVPAGSALAVDRDEFSAYITEKIKSSPYIEVIEKEAGEIHEDEITIVATGPLTSDKLALYISENLGCNQLHFYDAAAPIVDSSTIDMDKVFFASRYDKGDADYINCPMNEEQYKNFYNALITAEEAPLKEFDKNYQEKEIGVFEGCMPVEIMAKRGEDTLRFGPLKPVGIVSPKTGESFYAVVQLRRENLSGTMYNLVGFQTHLTFAEQKRVFRMIPGLEYAEFLRYGVMHRNTYLNSPDLLTPFYSLRNNRNIYFAGQMTGVEGYIESASSGFAAGVCASYRFKGIEEPEFPKETIIGSLAHYVSSGGLGSFQPMNANFGIIAPLEKKIKGGKKARYEAYASRSLEIMDKILDI